MRAAARHQRPARDRERLQRVRRDLQRDRDVFPRRGEEAAAEARLRRERRSRAARRRAGRRPARRARRDRAASVTSSSTIVGSVGSRRAARCVRLIARPNEVSTTSAPSSCARCATENAIDASLSTPVTRMRLLCEQHGVPSLEAQSGVLRVAARRLAVALRREHVERVARARAACRLGSITASTKPRSAARYGLSNASRTRRQLALASSARRHRASRAACRGGSAPRPARPSPRSRRSATRRTRSLPMPRESITMYAPPYALRSTTQSRGTVAAAYACTSSAPWRIMPRHSRSRPGLEAGRVDERDDRQVERVAPRDEPRRLARRLDVERAGAVQRLVGDDADRRGRRAWPSPVTRFGAYAARSSRKRVGVEHVVDRRRARRTTRSAAPGTAAAATSHGAIDGVVGARAAAGRRGGGRAGTQRSAGERVARRRPRRRTTSDATPVARSCTAAPPSSVATTAHAGELRDRVGPGHVRERVVGHHHVVERARAASAGPETHAPGHREQRRHDARHVRRARARAGPTRAARRRRRASSAPEVSSSPTSGICELDPRAAPRARRSRRR